MKIAEQLKNLKDQRDAKIVVMEKLHAVTLGDEGRTFTEDEQKSFDETKDAVDRINDQIRRSEELQQLQLTKSIPIRPDPAMTPEGSQPLILQQRNLPKGTAFTRYVGAMALAKGNTHQAAEIAKRWRDTTPEVEQVLKAAVAAGTTTDPTWAAPLVQYQTMTGEFIDLLRPATILGRLTGLRDVPFNTRMPRKTAGGTVGWVGEGLSKPVSKLAFDAVTFPFAKVAGIIVITEELARFSSPSAEALVRQDLVDTVAEFLDRWFVSDSAAVAGVSPPGIRAGVTAIPLAGGTLADLNAAMAAAVNAMTTAGIPMANLHWITHTTTVSQLAMMKTGLDNPAYPGLSPTGGSLNGVPVIASAAMTVDATPTPDETFMILIDASEILYASDGPVVIDVSREASLQMDSAPATPPTPLVSLWQQNMLGIKAEVFRYWLPRRAGAVQVIDGVPVSGMTITPTGVPTAVAARRSAAPPAPPHPGAAPPAAR